MRSVNCLIIEDSAIHVLALKAHLVLLPSVTVIGVKDNFEDAVGFIQQNLTNLDLIFLDINLSKSTHSGLDVLRVFPVLPPVIIITNHIEHAVSAFEIGKVVDYLVKPYTFERLALAVNRVLNINQNTMIGTTSDLGVIFLKMGRKLQKFEIADIEYIEAYGIYSKIMENGTVYVVNENISTLEKRIENPFLHRVHKSFIVNIRKINIIETYHIVIRDIKIPIGATFKERVDTLLKLIDSID
jgi:DNA-binding LytR/AlgR family response regulator